MAKQGELSTLWNDLKQSPAVLITVLFVVILIIYFVYKQNNGGTSSSTGYSSTGSDTLYFLDTSQGSYPGSGSSGSSSGSGGSGGSGGTGSGGSIVGKSFALTKAASLEDTPRGKVLQSIPQGADITVLTKTTKPDPQGSSKVYYWVNYNGKHGWLGSDSFNVGS